MGSFGERLRAIRQERSLTQRQLAEASGISQQAIAGYELDTREPGWSAVLKLAAALGVDANAFGQPPASPPAPKTSSKRK